MNTNETKSKFANGMSEEQWVAIYLDPIQAVKDGQEPSSDLSGGLAGFVLDGITAVSLIHSEEANDWECVLLVEQLITEAKQIVDKL